MTLFKKLAGKASALLNASGIYSNNCIDGHCSGCGECCADLLPHAPINEDNGILCIKPCDIDESIGCTNGKGCDDCYRKYWLTEVTDND